MLTIVHSDQGSHYGSDDWQRFCRANNMALSMSRRGNCQDNVVSEQFFSSLKKERIRKRIYKTRDLARTDISDYIEVFYNRARRHSHLGCVSSEAFEQASVEDSALQFKHKGSIWAHHHLLLNLSKKPSVR